MHMWSELHSGDKLLFAREYIYHCLKPFLCPVTETFQMQRELTSELSKVLAHIWIVGSNHNSTFQITILFHYELLISLSCKVIRFSALERLFIMVKISLFKTQQILFDC